MDPLITGILIVAISCVIAACIVAAAAVRPRRPPARPRALADSMPQPEFLARLPYARAPHLLAGEHRALFAALHEAVPADLAVLPHVRLADLLTIEAQTVQPERYRERLKDIVLDFVLCDAQTTLPRMAVLFEQPGAARGAAFVDAALVGAGIPVIRLPRDIRTPAATLEAEIIATLGLPSRSRSEPLLMTFAPPRSAIAREKAPLEFVVAPRTPARYACGRCHREIRAQARCCPHCGAVLTP